MPPSVDSTTCLLPIIILFYSVPLKLVHELAQIIKLIVPNISFVYEFTPTVLLQVSFLQSANE